MKLRNELTLFFFLIVAIPTIDVLIFRATDDLAVAVTVMVSLVAFLVFGLVNMDRIIAAFRRAQRGYGILINSANDGIFTINREIKIGFSNRKMSEIMGYSLKELQGRIFTDILDPEDRDKIGLLVSRPDHKGVLEARAVGKDGSRLFMQFNFSVMEDGEKLCVARDVTGMREVERMKQDFVSNVSHEIRSPLAAIESYVNMLMAHPNASSLAEYLNIIKNNTRRLGDFIDNLLDMSRIEKGKIELEKDYMNIQETTEESLELFGQQARDKGIEIELRIKEDILDVEADRDQIRQVMNNLLSNAIKFTPSGGKIVISADEKDGELEVCVKDTGPGIPEKEQGKLFHRFSRISGIDQRQKGTGLGLAIVKGIIEAHGGKVRAESHPGRGSVFSFTLPL